MFFLAFRYLVFLATTGGKWYRRGRLGVLISVGKGVGVRPVVFSAAGERALGCILACKLVEPVTIAFIYRCGLLFAIIKTYIFLLAVRRKVGEVLVVTEGVELRKRCLFVCKQRETIFLGVSVGG